MRRIDEVIRKILERRATVANTRSVLVGRNELRFHRSSPAEPFVAQDQPREHADLIFENN